jgi:hypothetical protein
MHPNAVAAKSEPSRGSLYRLETVLSALKSAGIAPQKSTVFAATRHDISVSRRWQSEYHCQQKGRESPMAVLDHNHHDLLDNKRVAGGAGQFCLFWVGVFAFVGLVSFLLKM